MGAGIAQAAAAAGHSVVLFDIDAGSRERGGAAIASSLARIVRKGTMTEADAAAVQERVTLADQLTAIRKAGIVIEAVTENLDIKRSLWQAAAAEAPETALLATNTSSLSVTQIASFSGRPASFCGLHFFNPVPVLPLVEVVRGELSSQETIDRAEAFVNGIGKTPLLCNDTPGFLVNRLLIPYMNDAVHALSEGVGTAEQIDTAMKLGANMPIGPLALTDLVGLDVALAAADSLYAEYQDPKFRVSPLLRRLVRAGKLGRKSGAGFHDYE
mgnify:CR=1 FL=1